MLCRFRGAEGGRDAQRKRGDEWGASSPAAALLCRAAQPIRFVLQGGKAGVLVCCYRPLERVHPPRYFYMLRRGIRGRGGWQGHRAWPCDFFRARRAFSWCAAALWACPRALPADKFDFLSVAWIWPFCTVYPNIALLKCQPRPTTDSLRDVRVMRTRTLCECTAVPRSAPRLACRYLLVQLCSASCLPPVAPAARHPVNPALPFFAVRRTATECVARAVVVRLTPAAWVWARLELGSGLHLYFFCPHVHKLLHLAVCPRATVFGFLGTEFYCSTAVDLGGRDAILTLSERAWIRDAACNAPRDFRVF